ncbi:hypothetical protein [Bacillus cereus]|uniref:hypothetical protein n=1 Tax=Bacillus cereus TaxID=1396 RepID=UPI0034C65E74
MYNLDYYNYDDYRQSTEPIYAKNAATNQLLMYQNNQWYLVLDPSKVKMEQQLFTCNCCVYRNPKKWSDIETTHSTGECPKKNFWGWPLETTFYDCSKWGC